MHGPLFSTITLFTELIVSAAVYYTLYQGYKKNKFPKKIAIPALIYESIFNISYMSMRVPTHAKAANAEPIYLILLAIIHGILSLIMFLSLFVFFIIAWKKYSNSINFFFEHKTLTWLFIVFWTFSIVSGVLFYFISYGI